MPPYANVPTATSGNSGAIASAILLMARMRGPMGEPSSWTIASSVGVWHSRPLSFWLTEMMSAWGCWRRYPFTRSIRKSCSELFDQHS